MKRIFTITALALAFFVLSVAPARAQHGYTIDKQVKFIGNKTSVSYKSQLSNRLETHTYHLKADKGKTLWVQIIAKNPEMTFQIFDAQDNEIGTPSDEDWYWEGNLAAAGEYTILVQTPRSAGNYTLNIKLK